MKGAIKLFCPKEKPLVCLTGPLKVFSGKSTESFLVSVHNSGNTVILSTYRILV